MTVFKTEHEPNAEVFPPVAVSKHTSTFAGYWKEFGLLLGVEERCVERLNILSLVVWKSGNLEIWKSGNLEICVERFNSYLTKLGRLEMWKSGNVEIYVERFNR